MSYTSPRTWVSGELVTAALMNTYVKDNQTAMYAGAMSVTSQAAYDLLYASSATQLARIATDTSGKVLTAAGSGAPAWQTNVEPPGVLGSNTVLQNYIGAPPTATYQSLAALTVYAGVGYDAGGGDVGCRAHFRTARDSSGEPTQTGSAITWQNDADATADVWLWADDIYLRGDVMLRAGRELKVSTAGAPTVYTGGTAGQVLTSGGAGVSPSWQTP